MTALQWDRLLETCCRRNGSDLLLAPGAPPMIRLRDFWHALQTAAVDQPAIQAFASQQLGARPQEEGDGYAYSDFEYGGGRFRATAFGYPHTRVLLVARYPADTLH